MDVHIDHASIDGSSDILTEIAGLLHQGRLDGDNSTAARAPRSHPDVGDRVLTFTGFTDDQYLDLVALLTALSTKLAATAKNLSLVDQSIAQDLDQFLTSGQLVRKFL